MASDLVIRTIDEQQWLDAGGSRAQELIHGAFDAAGPAGAGLKDLLHGVWLGHPLHPVLTDIPVGAWSVALVLDALENITGSEDFRSGADAAVGVGLLGALGAAVTGMTDFSETDGRGKKVAAVHGLLNVVATGLYAGSYFLRKSRRNRSAGVGLSMLGYLIAGGSAWLGGHLVFGEQIGVDHTAGPERGRPDDFVPVMRESELPERRLTRVEAGRVAILLVRIDGQVRALRETCAHLGGPLAEGRLEGDAVVCPWHGSTFTLEDGEVVRGPSCFPQPQYEVRVRDGAIEVRAASE